MRAGVFTGLPAEARSGKGRPVSENSGAAATGGCAAQPPRHGPAPAPLPGRHPGNSCLRCQPTASGERVRRRATGNRADDDAGAVPRHGLCCGQGRAQAPVAAHRRAPARVAARAAGAHTSAPVRICRRRIVNCTAPLLLLHPLQGDGVAAAACAGRRSHLRDAVAGRQPRRAAARDAMLALAATLRSQCLSRWRRLGALTAQHRIAGQGAGGQRLRRDRDGRPAPPGALHGAAQHPTVRSPCSADLSPCPGGRCCRKPCVCAAACRAPATGTRRAAGAYACPDRRVPPQLAMAGGNKV